MYCQGSCYSALFALTFCNLQMLIMATIEQYQLAGDIDSLVFKFSNQGKTYNGTESQNSSLHHYKGGDESILFIKETRCLQGK